MSFVHLHTHTEYSLLDGSNKITEYVARVKALGMDSAAITDHGVMYGAVDFYKAAKKAGINPVIGCEVYVAPGSRFDKNGTESDDRYYHLVLLAENNTGYSNLVKIVSKGFTEGFYYKPRVDMELLETYHEGLIALSACLAGEIPRALMRGAVEEAKSAALRYRDIFGKGNFFLELQDHGIPDQKRVNMILLNMSQELDIPLVATNDVHYTYAEDDRPHDILLCLQTGAKLSDENRMRYEGGQYYVKSEEEMARLFPYAAQALENTQKIADRCRVELTFGEYKIPHYDVPGGYDASSYLRHLCEEGFKERYPEGGEDKKSRLDYELSVIEKMGFVDYFLIVWDFINYAKSNDIPVGPGRGSAAGSIVSYCLHITDLDPIRYSLIFERFLNPERVTMPDIDIDFCMDRRQEVIDYVVKKYGEANVVQIITFNSLKAKNAVRDVARVMELPYSQADMIAKMIPMDLDITLAKALEINPDLHKLYNEDAQVHELIDMSMRLEGLPRNSSKHAAGVVICSRSVDEYVPLARVPDGSIVTQFTKGTVEELGLLKMDFLGLRNLTVIHEALESIKRDTGKTVDMSTLDYSDTAVFDYISTGRCEGIFQLESRGMKSFMKELRPASLEDVIAGISLYRPGPMDFIPKYIEGKNNADSVTYQCEELRPILEPTYGCIVYQEQVMQIVRDLAGFSMGRSDGVRKAMSKKDLKKMEEERGNFIYGNKEAGVEGCINRGIPESVAGRIYESMIDFAKYAFNKSHAACYSVVAYQTAWLKLYYPTQYMAALMSSVEGNTSKIINYIRECQNMKISVLPPDINEGYAGFSTSGRNIRYGLSAIKGVGSSVIGRLVEERRAGGAFRNLGDFAERTVGVINKKCVEGFIKAGAFDCFGANRRQMLLSCEEAIDRAASKKKHTMSGQMSLFDIMSSEEKKKLEVKLPDIEEFPKEMLLSYEKEVLGIYVSGHPLEAYEKLWRKHVTARATDFAADEESGECALKDGVRVTVGGIVSEVRTRRTRTDKLMANVTIEDLYGNIEMLVWPNIYERYGRCLSEDARIFVKGKVQLRDEQNAELICDEITPFEDMPRTLWIQFATEKEYERSRDELNGLIGGCSGKDRVVIYLSGDRKKMSLPPDMNVRADRELMEALSRSFGEENVRLT